MKITLLKDLESPDGNFKAGETVDVSEATYNWLMSVYMAERAKQVEMMLAGEAKLKQWGAE